MAMVVGAIAANRESYSVGMGRPVEDIQKKRDAAIANPVPARLVDKGARPWCTRARICRARAAGLSGWNVPAPKPAPCQGRQPGAGEDPNNETPGPCA